MENTQKMYEKLKIITGRPRSSELVYQANKSQRKNHSECHLLYSFPAVPGSADLDRSGLPKVDPSYTTEHPCFPVDNQKIKHISSFTITDKIIIYQ